MDSKISRMWQIFRGHDARAEELRIARARLEMLVPSDDPRLQDIRQEQEACINVLSRMLRHKGFKKALPQLRLATAEAAAKA